MAGWQFSNKLERTLCCQLTFLIEPLLIIFNLPQRGLRETMVLSWNTVAVAISLSASNRGRERATKEDRNSCWIGEEARLHRLHPHKPPCGAFEILLYPHCIISLPQGAKQQILVPQVLLGKVNTSHTKEQILSARVLGEPCDRLSAARETRNTKRYLNQAHYLP